MTMVTQPPAGVTMAEAVIACAIFCCDKKKYSLPEKKPPQTNEKTCQRIGNRKHSCVLHELREKKGKKLTKKDKFKTEGIQASPRFEKKDQLPPGVDRTLIPDTIVGGNRVIDAKFPCKPEEVHGPGDKPPGTGKGFTKGGKKAYPSDARKGTEMITPKEEDYKLIPGVKKVECMTPKDAETKKGDCKCSWPVKD